MARQQMRTRHGLGLSLVHEPELSGEPAAGTRTEMAVVHSLQTPRPAESSPVGLWSARIISDPPATDRPPCHRRLAVKRPRGGVRYERRSADQSHRKPYRPAQTDEGIRAPMAPTATASGSGPLSSLRCSIESLSSWLRLNWSGSPWPVSCSICHCHTPAGVWRPNGERSGAHGDSLMARVPSGSEVTCNRPSCLV
jgi:hypothetical protein